MTETDVPYKFQFALKLVKRSPKGAKIEFFFTFYKILSLQKTISFSVFGANPISVVCCMIWYYLFNLKNVKNTHGGVLILVLGVFQFY